MGDQKYYIILYITCWQLLSWSKNVLLLWNLGVHYSVLCWTVSKTGNARAIYLLWQQKWQLEHIILNTKTFKLYIFTSWHAGIIQRVSFQLWLECRAIEAISITTGRRQMHSIFQGVEIVTQESTIKAVTIFRDIWVTLITLTVSKRMYSGVFLFRWNLYKCIYNNCNTSWFTITVFTGIIALFFCIKTRVGKLCSLPLVI
jgi:hypothetical protein